LNSVKAAPVIDRLAAASLARRPVAVHDFAFRAYVPAGRAVCAMLVGMLAGVLMGCSQEPNANAGGGSATATDSVTLTATQQRSVTVMPATERTFTVEHAAVGVIDFNQDRTVQVSPPYAGRVLRVVAQAGEHVRRGELLFTIASPDLVQAESTLIAAAGTLQLTTRALQRAQGLYAIQGLAQKDYEQAASDQHNAEGAYRAARDALRIFGKTDAEIDRIAQQRRIDQEMPVLSPSDGVVTARSAAPGMLVQPGSSPAPLAVAAVASKWMLADVPEVDAPSLALGQDVDVKLLAFPDRIFHGRISYIAEAVDPATRRVRVRSEIADPHDELRAQMFASFTVHVGGAARSVAVPYAAVVREGDGTMTVWVTTDRQRFQRRSVRLGEQQDGYDQILAGLRAGELIAGSGALFISTAAVQDAAQ
jgi:membrane fusion protein, heavy metal efflux system